MMLMERRRALMENDVLWEWVPSKGLSNITLTASSGYTPNYELRPDCIRLKAPSTTDLKQTIIVITNPPKLPSKVWFEVSVKNFPVLDRNSVSCYLRGDLTGNVLYSSVTGAYLQTYRTKKIRGQSIITEQITNIPAQFTLKMLKDNNTATAFFPDGTTLSVNVGDAGFNPRIVSCEAKDTGYFDITRITIRRAT